MVIISLPVAVPAQVSAGNQNAGVLSIGSTLSAVRSDPGFIANDTTGVDSAGNDTLVVDADSTNPFIVNHTVLGSVGPVVRPAAHTIVWARLVGAIVLAALIIPALRLVGRRK